MEDDVYIPLVKCEFQHGSDEMQAFKNICRDHESDPPLNYIISNYFDRFGDFDLSLLDEIGIFHYSLLRAIVLQYSKFSYAIFCRDDDVRSRMGEAIIQDRFKLVANDVTASFEIFDSFNEGLKILPTTVNAPASLFFPTLINHNRILLNVSRHGPESLLLLDAGFDQLSSSVLHEISLEFVCRQIIRDSSNNLRFLVRDGIGGNAISVYRGHIANDQIHLDQQKIPFEVPLFCCKLEGDRLFAIKHEDESGNWHYVEYDLSLNLARKVNQWSCYATPGHAEIFYGHYEYVWSSNKLYAVRAFDEYFSIVTFDVDTLTWSKTKFVGAGRVNKLMIDEDEILSISATEESDDFNDLDGFDEPISSKVVYRLPMRKPGKLRYIAWFKLRRQALFFGSTLYKRLAQQLPYTSEFREFSENY